MVQWINIHQINLTLVILTHTSPKHVAYPSGYMDVCCWQNKGSITLLLQHVDVTIPSGLGPKH